MKLRYIIEGYPQGARSTVVLALQQMYNLYICCNIDTIGFLNIFWINHAIIN